MAVAVKKKLNEDFRNSDHLLLMYFRVSNAEQALSNSECCSTQVSQPLISSRCAITDNVYHMTLIHSFSASIGPKSFLYVKRFRRFEGPIQNLAERRRYAHRTDAER